MVPLLVVPVTSNLTELPFTTETVLLNGKLGVSIVTESVLQYVILSTFTEPVAETL